MNFTSIILCRSNHEQTVHFKCSLGFKLFEKHMEALDDACDSMALAHIC